MMQQIICNYKKELKNQQKNNDQKYNRLSALKMALINDHQKYGLIGDYFNKDGDRWGPKIECIDFVPIYNVLITSKKTKIFSRETIQMIINHIEEIDCQDNYKNFYKNLCCNFDENSIDCLISFLTELNDINNINEDIVETSNKIKRLERETNDFIFEFKDNYLVDRTTDCFIKMFKKYKKEFNVEI